MTATEIIANVIGVLAIALGFLSYQTKSRKGVLALQTLTTVTFTVHYLLLGAYSGMLMNVVGIARNIFYYNKDKKFFSWRWWPVVFAVIAAALGILAWEDWYSVFVVVGITINTVCMSLSAQNIRKSILVTSPMVLIYDVFAKSVSGAVYEAVAIVSAAIGIYRFSKRSRECDS